jgi:putative glycosyltransferase (TIGR04372 family)
VEINRVTFIEIFKNFLRVIKYLLNALWAVPLVLISRVIYPRFKIKFGVSQSTRIGHFIPDTLEELIRMQKVKKEIIFWSATLISNKQWYKMVRRYMYIGPIHKYSFFWNRYIPGSLRHTSVMSTNSSRDPKGNFFSDLIKPKMSESDTIKSKKLLEQIGWKGEPFICLLSRDNAYLDYLDKLPGQFNHDRSYHSYRNSDIETYRLAINHLLDKGYWVFRMGTITEKKLKISHKNFLDYPYFDRKCDLLDIYLFSNCAGLISTSTGIDGLSQAYGIPTLIVNGLPLGLATTFFNTIWVPKNLTWNYNNQSLTVKEYIENFYMETSDYITAGINLRDLSENQILNAVMELVTRIENTGIVSESDIFLQETFLNLLKNWGDFSRYHQFINPGFKIGRDWINSMRDKMS